MIIQGRNDSSPPRTVVAYEAAMRALGKALVVIWYESGHMGSITNGKQGIEHQSMMLNFAQTIAR